MNCASDYYSCDGKVPLFFFLKLTAPCSRPTLSHSGLERPEQGRLLERLAGGPCRWGTRSRGCSFLCIILFGSSSTLQLNSVFLSHPGAETGGGQGPGPPNAPVAPLAKVKLTPAMTCGKTVGPPQSLLGLPNDQILAPPC